MDPHTNPQIASEKGGQRNATRPNPNNGPVPEGGANFTGSTAFDSTSEYRRSHPLKKRITHQQKVLAEQRRREAVKETSIDLLAIENLRAMARMSEDEVKQSKNIIMCFLAGEGDRKAGLKKNGRGDQFMEDFQHDVNSASCGAFHYCHDPSQPLPLSLWNKNETKSLEQKQAENSDTNNPIECVDAKDNAGNLKRKSENNDDSNRPAKISVRAGNNFQCDNGQNELQSSVNSSSESDKMEYTLVRNQWVCKKCISVPPSFRSMGATTKRQPSREISDRHGDLCRGEKPDLSVLVNTFLDLTKSTKIRFHHLSSKEFKSVVRAIVGGEENFVTLFTDDVRKMWLGQKKNDDATTEVDWCKYPFNVIPDREENTLAALANFARTGVGFNFVENPHFVTFVGLISPGFKTPSEVDLINCW